MMPSHETDRQMLFRCFSGDKKASERLVRRFSDLVYKSVQYTLMSKNVQFKREDVEDLHNTVFLHLFENECKKLRQYKGKNGCSLASWIRLIAVRTALNHLRKKGYDSMASQKRQISLEDLHALKGGETDALCAVEKAEQRRLVEEGIEALPPRDRLFMKLHFNDGLSIREVAAAMHLSIENTYSVKHRTIQRLRSYVASMTCGKRACL